MLGRLGRGAGVMGQIPRAQCSAVQCIERGNGQDLIGHVVTVLHQRAATFRAMSGV